MRLVAWILAWGLVAGCAARTPRTDSESPSTQTPRSVEQKAAGLKTQPGRSIPADGPLGFDDLAALARARNPELIAAAEAVRAASGRVEQSDRYPNPSAEAEVEEYDGDDAGQAETTVRLRQPIVLGRQRGEARRAAEEEQRALEHRLAALELETLGELRALHAELLYLRESLVLAEDLIALARSSLDTAEQRFELRASPESDVSRARVEMFDLELARREFARDTAQAEARLGELLGGVRISSAQLKGGLQSQIDAVSTPTLLAWIELSHPELERARAETRAAQARVRHARAERMPDFEVFAGAAYSGAEDETFAEGGVSIELPIFDRNQGRITEAQADWDRAQTEEDAVAIRLESELIQAAAAWQAAHERAVYHEEQILSSAHRSFAQIEEGYRAGKFEFLDLLDAQRTLTEARLQQIELKREILDAEAQLWGLAGPAIDVPFTEYSESEDNEGGSS